MSASRIAVVVTVKNDSVALQKLLDSLEAQTRLPDEVVITVAASRDASLTMARLWQPKGIEVTIIDVGWATRSVGRNRGVAATDAEIIAFTDAGCFPEPQWLEKLVESILSGQVAVTSGFTVGQYETDFEEAQLPFVLVPLHKIEKNPLAATRNMAITRSLFWQHEGFRPFLNYAEDYDFSLRLRSAGVSCRFVPEAKVLWQPRPSMGSFYTMIFNLTAGDVLAGRYRFGLATMWLRYSLLLFFLGSALQFFHSWTLSLILTGLLYLSYLLIKSGKHQQYRWKLRRWLPALQATCDLGVLFGSLYGIVIRIIQVGKKI